MERERLHTTSFAHNTLKAVTVSRGSESSPFPSLLHERKGRETRCKSQRSLATLQGAILVLLCFISFRILNSSSIFPLRSALKSADYDAAVSKFCHSDPGIIHQEFPRDYISKKNCYGDFNKDSSSVTFLRSGVEVPSRTASSLGRCRNNPYHAFYDCIWPLMHYISTCVHHAATNGPTVVLHARSLGIESKTAWGDGALRASLRGLRAESVDFNNAKTLPVRTAVCFRSLTKFKNDTEWRPLRYSATLPGATNATTVPHTERSKQLGLEYFRKLVLQPTGSYGLGGGTASNVQHGHILVYDRHDVQRRRWLNGFDFAVRLNRTVGERLRVVYMWRMPGSFEEQVRVHREAMGIVGPQGAAMANTVFMREDAVVVEIASRHCIEKNVTEAGEVGSLAGTTREDSWTGWHSSRLRLNHVTMPCQIKGNRGRNFVTGNDVLLRVSQSLLQIAQLSKGHSEKGRRIRSEF